MVEMRVTNINSGVVHSVSPLFGDSTYCGQPADRPAFEKALINAEVTCKSCRKAMGLPPVGYVNPYHIKKIGDALDRGKENWDIQRKALNTQFYALSVCCKYYKKGNVAGQCTKSDRGHVCRIDICPIMGRY